MNQLKQILVAWDFSPGAEAALAHRFADAGMNVVLADVTGDGRPDLIAVVRGNAAVAVAVNEGGGRFAAPRLFRAGTDPRDVAVGDMDGDGRADLVVADYSGAVGVLRSLGGGDLDTVQLATADLGAVGVRLSDRNGDKRLDAVVVSERSNTAAIFLNDGMGRLSAGARVALGRSDARSLAIADVDGDNIDDLLVGHDLGAAVADQLTLARGQADGGFMAGVVVTGSGRAIYGVQVADIDDDRRRDVVVASLTDHKLTVLRGLSNGTLQSQNAVYAGQDPTGLAIGDLDGDGFNDIAIANQIGGFVSVLSGMRKRSACRFASRASS